MKNINTLYLYGLPILWVFLSIFSLDLNAQVKTEKKEQSETRIENQKSCPEPEKEFVEEKIEEAKKMLPDDWGKNVGQKESNVDTYGRPIVNRTDGLPAWSQADVDGLLKAIEMYKTHVENLNISLGNTTGVIDEETVSGIKRMRIDYEQDEEMLTKDREFSCAMLGNFIGQAMSRNIDFTGIISYSNPILKQKTVANQIIEALKIYENNKASNTESFGYEYSPSQYSAQVQNIANYSDFSFNQIYEEVSANQNQQYKSTPSGYYEKSTLSVGTSWLSSPFDVIFSYNDVPYPNMYYFDDSYDDWTMSNNFRFYERLDYDNNTAVRVSINGYLWLFGNFDLIV